MDALKEFLERCLLYCSWNDNRIDRMKCLHQAFGAVEFYSAITHSTQEWSEIEALWEEYKPKFEELVYGVA